MIKKYYRLTKPGIIYSNIMTAAAGFLFASDLHVNWYWTSFVAILVGNALIIASACVFNNYIDRGIDAKMLRTHKRSLVSGEIKSINAIVYASILGAVGFIALSQTNLLTLGIGVVAFFSYVALYGIAKRKTVHGTLVGTLPGSASLVAGYTAVQNQLNSTVALLFLIMIAWQMAHFYSIAMFRFNDYKNADLPVWPVKKGMKSTKLQIIFYVFIFIIANNALSVYGYSGLTYMVVMSAIGLYWLWRGVRGFNAQDDTKWARGMFGFSLIVLLVFCAILSIGAVLP